ncbi:hypothetical protein ACA910_018507 [Epithemia clementina (nom. ined.)]
MKVQQQQKEVHKTKCPRRRSNDTNDPIRNLVCRSVLRAVLEICGGEKEEEKDDDKGLNSHHLDGPSSADAENPRLLLPDKLESKATTTTASFQRRIRSSRSLSFLGISYDDCWKEWVSQTITQTTRGAAEHDLQGKPWDYEVRTGTSIYHRFKDKQTQELVLISNLGLRRTIRSPVEMGTLLGEWIQQQRHNPFFEQECNDNYAEQEHEREGDGNDHANTSRLSSSSSSASSSSSSMMLLEGFYMSVSSPSGFLLLVSPQRRQALYELAERWPCPYCCQWLKGGSKGLWWHVQQQHGHTHAAATQHAQQTQHMLLGHNALVLYKNNNNHHHHQKKNHATNQDNSHQHQENSTNTTRNTGNKEEEKTPTPTKTRFFDTTTVVVNAKSSPFALAAQGDLQTLQTLWIDTGHLDPQKDVDHNGATVLLWAAGGGHLELVRYLVETCQCHPQEQQQQLTTRNNRGFGGRTALHWAARKGHDLVVEYLLNWAATTTTTAAGTSAARNHGGVDEDENGNDNNNLTIKTMLEACTTDGTTALGWAAWQAHLPVLQVLYRYGVNVHSVNNYGCNAALWAAQGGTTTTTASNPRQSSRRHGGTNNTLNLGCNENKSSHDSVVNADEEQRTILTLRWLDSVGCDLFHINHNGHGILHKAAQRNRMQVAQWFVHQKLNNLQKQEPHDIINLRSEHTGPTTTTTAAVASPSNQQQQYQQQFEYSDHARAERLHSLLPLIGPDGEGCTPSDLAGMEGFAELAQFLVEFEDALVSLLYTVWWRATKQQHHDSNGLAAATNNNGATTTMIWPSWLGQPKRPDDMQPPMPGVKQDSTPTSSFHDTNGASLWGPGCGVHRLQRVVSAAVTAEAQSDEQKSNYY